jgi:hypothetical protein
VLVPLVPVNKGSVSVAARVAVAVPVEAVALRKMVSIETTDIVVPVSELPVPKTFGI